MRGEQRARGAELGFFNIEPRHLPIPPRQGQFELRFAKLSRLKPRIVARRRHVSDDGAKIDVQALVERLFRRAAINAGNDDARHQQQRHAPHDGGQKEPLGDRPRLCAPQPPNHQRGAPETGGSSK